MNIAIELLKMKRRLKNTARNILFGKPPNRSRDYLASAGPFELVVHVGAHIGQEAELYRSLGAQHVIWIEGDPDTYVRLVAELAKVERQGARPIKHETVCALVSDATDRTRSFHRSTTKELHPRSTRPPSDI